VRRVVPWLWLVLLILGVTAGASAGALSGPRRANRRAEVVGERGRAGPQVIIDGAGALFPSPTSCAPKARAVPTKIVNANRAGIKEFLLRACEVPEYEVGGPSNWSRTTSSPLLKSPCPSAPLSGVDSDAHASSTFSLFENRSPELFEQIYCSKSAAAEFAVLKGTFDKCTSFSESLSEQSPLRNAARGCGRRTEGAHRRVADPKPQGP
jgi:hypothetical protein